MAAQEVEAFVALVRAALDDILVTAGFNVSVGLPLVGPCQLIYCGVPEELRHRFPRMADLATQVPPWGCVDVIIEGPYPEGLSVRIEDAPLDEVLDAADISPLTRLRDAGVNDERRIAAARAGLVALLRS